MSDWVIKEVGDDASSTENEETPDNTSSEEVSEDTGTEKRTSKQERQKKKAELQAELDGLEDELQNEAEQAAEEVAAEEPDNSEIKRESKDEAEAIAAGHNLTSAEENRLAEAISTKVVAILGDRVKTRDKARPVDRRPKPTHWSERSILRRGSE